MKNKKDNINFAVKVGWPILFIVVTYRECEEDENSET